MAVTVLKFLYNKQKSIITQYRCHRKLDREFIYTELNKENWYEYAELKQFNDDFLKVIDNHI